MGRTALIIQKCFATSVLVAIFAKKSGLLLEDALAFFYDSDTYMLISEGVADMHCRSDEYLADELMIEFKEKQL